MATPSLRERQRDATRREIHAAVRGLSAELGFDNVTVELISGRAGISQRTFFNYFPSKEAALLASPPVQLRGEFAERFSSGPPAAPQRVLVDLTQILLEQLAEDPPDREGARAIFTVATASPAVFAALVAQLDTVRSDLAHAVAGRLAPASDPQLPDLIAAVAMASVRSGLEAWVADASESADASPVPYVRHAVRLMASLAGSAGE